MNHRHQNQLRMGGIRRRRLVWFFLLPGAMVCCLAAGLVWVRMSLAAMPGTAMRVVSIAPGASAHVVADTLKRAGLIHNAFWFRVYLSHKGIGRHIQAGRYELRQGQSVAEIASTLARGAVQSQTVRVTIPEGYTALQIADTLARTHVCNREQFLDAVQHHSYAQHFLSEIRKNQAVKYRLEGYLFPDTYEFVVGEPVDAVVGAMLDNFVRHVTPLQTTGHQTTMSLQQLVTKASMVEKEAKVSGERPVIASVIDNRLRRGMKLQIDATVQYGMGGARTLSLADTRRDDPYNTYMHDGLPPGPIANPGMASIRAALRPAHTDYLYYVVRNDGTGRDYFARTYREQRTNIRRSQLNLAEHSD